jgi:hypothetical protein
MWDAHGIVDTTTEQIVFYVGLYLALPCGLLSIVAGIKALRKGSTKKAVAITGIVTGILNIFVGIISWIWFFMISAFAAAFS